MIGFYDDFSKIQRRSSEGLTAKQKIFFQFIAASVVALLIYNTAATNEELFFIIPFFKEVQIDMGSFFILFSCFVIQGWW